MPNWKRWNSNNSKKKKETKQQSERQTESEERQERRTSSQTLNDQDFDHGRWYSTGDLNRRPYWFNSLPSINNDVFEFKLKKLEEVSSRSQERMDRMEQQTSQFMQNADYTNRLVQNLCQSVESLVKMADDDLFYKSDYAECNDDLISEAPHKDVVRESLLDIKDNLDTEYILDELYAKKAIDHDERQSVQGQTTDARKTRRLAIILEKKPPATFEAFLSVLNGDKQLSWLYEELKRKYEVAKRGDKSKCCHFCYVCKNTDIRHLADHMYRNLSLDLIDYNYLINDSTSETERWQILRNITPEVSEARDGFINALQDVYPQVENKVRFFFTIDKGTLICTCSNLNRRTSKNCEPRTIKKRPGAKIARDIKPYFAEDDQDTIDKFLSEENASIVGSDNVPDIVATNRPKEMELSTPTARQQPKSSPKVEASPIISYPSEEVLGTSDMNDNEINETGVKTVDQSDDTRGNDIIDDNKTTTNDTEKWKVETNDGDRYKYLSFVLGLVVLVLFLMIMTPNGMTGFISFVKDVPHRILDACLYSNTKNEDVTVFD